MNVTENGSKPLPGWYDRLLSNPLLMVLGVVCVLLVSPLLLVYGALLPLVRR
ncbi:MAG: hypothetical protein AB7D92_04815 [Sphaerochaeta sp.]